MRHLENVRRINDLLRQIEHEVSQLSIEAHEANRQLQVMQDSQPDKPALLKL